jgi:hypothetical protein
VFTGVNDTRQAMHTHLEFYANLCRVTNQLTMTEPLSKKDGMNSIIDQPYLDANEAVQTKKSFKRPIPGYANATGRVMIWPRMYTLPFNDFNYRNIKQRA